MNTQDIGWISAADLEEKIRAAALANVPTEDAPQDYLTRRAEYRKRHQYTATVDENLLIISCGRSAYSDHEEGGLVIPLPSIRGVSGIYKNYTSGRGSAVDLLAYDITLSGTTPKKFVIYQDEPFSWWGAEKDERNVLRDQEMAWHKQRLVLQRHEVLSAINGYINRVLQLSPENRQLKLGF